MITALIIVFGLIVGADYDLTLLGLKNGLGEYNPILCWAHKRAGGVGLALVMGMFLIVTIVCMDGLSSWHPWAGYSLGVFAIAWRGVVVYKNFRLIRGKK